MNEMPQRKPIYFSTIEFRSGANTLQGRICSSGVDEAPGVLFLAGGGYASHDIYHEWQQKLAEVGISSLAFSFPGVDGSTGDVKESSLLSRRKDAEAALLRLIAEGVDPSRICIVGRSMGGHIAIQMIGGARPKALILLSPAAYDRGAEKLSFDESFTAAIRSEESWRNTTSFSSLESYTGSLLVVYGKNDEVIPREVAREYKRIAEAKVHNSGTYLELEGVGHRFMFANDEKSERARQTLYTESARFLEVSL